MQLLYYRTDNSSCVVVPNPSSDNGPISRRARCPETAQARVAVKVPSPYSPIFTLPDQLWPETGPENVQEIIEPFAGAGPEALRDGSYDDALFAQSNGLALDDSRVLYVADSETSAVRAIALSGLKKVTTLVGTGLFDFGDVDGVGEEVRLQHVQAVCFVDGLLYLADTYNNRIKVLNPQTREVRSFAGSGVAGLQDGAPDEAQFNEPAGLAAAGGKLYVADTNNSALRVIDLATGNFETLNVRM